MLGGGHHIDQIADFIICAMQRGIRHEDNIDMRHIRLKLSDDGDRGIVGLPDAKNDLQCRIVQFAE